MTDPPTRSEVRLAAIIVALCALILTSALAYGVVRRVNQGDEIVRTAASEADQVERLNAQLDAQAKAATAERATLIAEIHALQLQQHAVVVYLRRHGVTIPRTVFSTPRTDEGLTRPKVPKAQPSPRPHHPRNPGTPAPTGSTPSPNPLAWLCAALLEIPACPRL